MIANDLAPLAREVRRTTDGAAAIARATDETLSRFRRDTRLRFLITLNRAGKHIYPGTVPAAVTAERRKRNRVARRQRRVNRVRNFRKGVR